MRELFLAGLVAILFGLGSYYATRHLGAFSLANLSLGALALLVAVGAGARRLRSAGGPHARAVLLRGAALVAGAAALGVALERGSAALEARFDWTFERRFALSDATRERLAALDGPLEALLFHDPLDPRVRRTRLLLDQMAQAADGRLTVRDRVIDEHPQEADRFAIATSNTVVLRDAAGAWERADRPNEGTLFEALFRLTSPPGGTILVLRGEGQGDPQRTADVGYAGLSEALGTEGYHVRSTVSATLRAVPGDVAAVILLAPERRLLPHALEALDDYLSRGGRLVAFLEPGRESGVEELLARWGIRSPDALVVDPASGPVEEGGAEGTNIIAYNYEMQPATRGLDRNRVTYFPGARPLLLHKPRIDDELERLVLSSPRAWVSEDLSWLDRRSGRPTPDGAETGYQTLAASGRYPREGGEARIVVFGDADLASNRYLRSIYNLDLVLNAVLWATSREPQITLRPKIRDTVQFPVPLNDSVSAFYGMGLLLPELLLIAGGIVWLRRRSA